MAYTKYSLTPANNNAAPPDGAPEGMLPSAVNDTMRDMMAQIRDVGDGIRGGTYTMTAPVITGGSITGAAFTGNTFTSPVISGGSINNATIGATTANTGAFTTLSATGATTFSGATVVSGSLTANTFSSSDATITGGSVSGITDLAIADGGTGASTAAAARTNLGLDGFVNMKNRIINGAMVIDQRNAGASVSVTTSNVFGVDRWKFDNISPSTYTVQQSSVAPTGFSFSSLVTVGTGAASAAADYVRILQLIEGFNTADLMWGTANAKAITLSFWVRSSIAGTYCVGFQNSATDYSYPINYTINSANTWEYKTITVAGPTAGTWLGATNGVGISCVWDLGSGSNWNGTNATWQNGNTWKTSSQTAFTATSGATFYITGVQLEVGSTATSFDYRPYGTELALCQRYFQLAGGAASGSFDGSTTTIQITEKLLVSMRTTPSGSIQPSGYAGFRSSATDFNAASPALANFASSTPTSFWTQVTGFTSGTSNAVVTGRNNNANNNFIALSAEL